MKLAVLTVCAFCSVIAPTLNGRASAVALSVNLMTNQIIFGEPLVVEVDLQNSGTTTVATIQDLDIIHGSCQYCIAGSNGVFKPIQPSVYLDWTAKEKPLSSGATIRHEQVLLYDPERDDVIVAQPGKYSLQVVVGARKSNTVQFAVKEPSTELEKTSTYRLYRNKRVLRHLQWPLPKTMAEPLEDDLIETCLKEVTEVTPTLVCLTAERLAGPGTPKERTGKLLKMLDAADAATYSWRSKAIGLKVRLYRQLGDNVKMVEQLDRLQRDYPSSVSAWTVQRQK